MKKLFAVLLAALAALTLFGCQNTEKDSTGSDSATVGETTADTVKVMTYAEFLAAEADSKVTVEAYVQAKQSWWKDDKGVGKATLYTQDQDGAYFIYELPMEEDQYNKLTTGTKIRVTGSKAVWEGEIEIMNGTLDKVLEGNYVAPAVDVTAKLGTDDLATYMNRFVAFKGMTVAAKKDANGNDVAFLYKWNGAGQEGDDLYFDVTLDGKTYTFHLRDGVKWHDGAPFSARDVVYTYTALTSDKTLTSTITSNYQDISRISAPDEHTVVIRLARVNAAMLDNFCMGILPAHLYEGHDINTVPANHAPVGTGRFKFVSWDTAGGMIVLERNTDYYGKVPSIERIVYKTVAVESTKALMLRSGEADLAWLNAKYARTFRGKDGFTTVDFTTADLRTVAMDFHTPFWQRNKDSIAVLNYAVDKQAIVDGVLAGQGFPAFSPIQTSPLGGNPAADVYPYDLKKFAAEMERLGWKKGPDGIYARNGERFSFIIQVRDYEEERVDIINVLSRQFKKAGVEMNIALVTRFDWKAGYNGYLAGFAAEFDPDGVFKSFVTGASDNNMAYSSPKVDELLREGRATEDPAKRKAAYQAFEVAYAAMPAQLPLVYLHGNYVSVAGLKGLDTTRVLGHHAVGVMWNIEDWTLQR